MNQSGPPQLPPGWIALWDESAQRYYYVEEATGTSQWEVPTEASKATAAGLGSRGEADSFHSGYSQSSPGYPQSQQQYPQSQQQYPQQQGFPNNDTNPVATSYPNQQNYNGGNQQQPVGANGMPADGPDGERGIGKIFHGFSGGAIAGSLIGLAAGKLLGNNKHNGGNHGGYGNYGPPSGPPPQGYYGYGPPGGYGGGNHHGHHGGGHHNNHHSFF